MAETMTKKQFVAEFGYNPTAPTPTQQDASPQTKTMSRSDFVKEFGADPFAQQQPTTMSRKQFVSEFGDDPIANQKAQPPAPAAQPVPQVSDPFTERPTGMERFTPSYVQAGVPGASKLPPSVIGETAKGVVRGTGYTARQVGGALPEAAGQIIANDMNAGIQQDIREKARGPYDPIFGYPKPEDPRAAEEQMYREAELRSRAKTIENPLAGQTEIARRVYAPLTDSKIVQPNPEVAKATYWDSFKNGNLDVFFAKLGSDTGQMVVPMAATLGAAAVGGPGAAGVVGGGLEGLGQFEKAIQSGADPAEALRQAGIFGVGTGLLNAVPFTRPITKFVPKQYQGTAFKAVAGLFDALAEGGTESLEGGVQTLAELQKVPQTKEELYALLSAIGEGVKQESGVFLPAMVTGGGITALDVMSPAETFAADQAPAPRIPQQPQEFVQNVENVPPQQRLQEEAQAALGQPEVPVGPVQVPVVPEGPPPQTAPVAEAAPVRVEEQQQAPPPVASESLQIAPAATPDAQQPALPVQQQPDVPRAQPDLGPSTQAAPAPIVEPLDDILSVLREEQRTVAPPPAVQPESKATTVSIPRTIGGMSVAPKVMQQHEAIGPSKKQYASVPAQMLYDNLDPDRFQFKREKRVGKTGATYTSSISGATSWNEKFEGKVSAWIDPQDGKIYPVNGHNRLSKWGEFKGKGQTVPDRMDVELIDAATPDEARLHGALENIAEGHGTALDAAGVFKETGMTPDEMRQSGLNLKSGIASDGMALSNLHPILFDSVRSEEDGMTANKGVIIGNTIKDQGRQFEFWSALRAREQRTKHDFTLPQIRELTDNFERSDRVQVESEQTMIEGTEEPEYEETFWTKGELQSYIGERLKNDKRLFSTVSKQGNAQRLAEAGNIIDTETSKGISAKAAVTLTVFDELKHHGEIADIIREAARSIIKGENSAKAKQRAYEAVAAAIPNLVSRGPSASAGVVQGQLAGSQTESVAGQVQEEPVDSIDPNQADLFGAEEESVAPEQGVPQQETGWSKGDRIAFTNEEAPDGFRSFVYLEGHKKGQTGLKATEEQVAKNVARNKAEYAESQAGFRRLKSAASEAGQGLRDVVRGIGELGGGDRLGIVPQGFDETSWARAKERLDSAYQHFVKAGKDIREFVRMVLAEFGDSAEGVLTAWYNERNAPQTPQQPSSEPAQVPPSSTPSAEAPVEAPTLDAVGLKRAEADRIRAEAGLPPMEPGQGRTLEESTAEAKRRGYDKTALDIAEDLIATGRAHDDYEYAGMTLAAVDLMKQFREANQAETDAIVSGNTTAQEFAAAQKKDIASKVNLLTEASTPAGTQASLALGIRRMMMNEMYEIVPVINRATISKGGRISDERAAEYAEAVTKLKEQEAQLEALQAKHDETLAKLEKAQAEIQAKRELKKDAIRSKAKGYREKVLAEREDIKAQLRAMGHRVNDVTGVTTEGSYLVGRLALTYIKEGAVDLNEAVRLVLADMPNLTERDVIRSINTRNPKTQKKARTETQRKIAIIKREADLLTQIQDILEGQPARSDRKPAETTDEIKALRSRLRQLRAISLKDARDESKLEAAKERYDALENKLKNHQDAIQEGKTQDPEELQAIKQDIADLRAAIKAEDEAAKIQWQRDEGIYKPGEKPPLRQKPEFLVEKQREAKKQKLLADIELAERGIFAETRPRQLTPKEIKDLQDKFRRLKRQAFFTVSDGKRLTHALETIGKLQKHLQDRSRAIKKRKRLDPPELAEAKQNAANLRKQMKLEDELTDLNRQIETGVFKTKERKAPRPVPPEIEKLQIATRKAKKTIDEMIEAEKPMTAGRVFDMAYNTTRATMGTADVSTTARQNAIILLSHPIMTARKFIPSLKAMGSRAALDKIMNEILSNPYAQYLEKAGVKMNDVETHAPGKGEEVFMSNLAEYIPVWRQIMFASNRHMAALGNMIRAQLFYDWMSRNEGVSDQEMAAYGDATNIFTGQGNLEKFHGLAQWLLTHSFFSSTLAASRFQAPYVLAKYWNMPRVRKQIIRDLGGAVAGGMTLLTLAAMCGFKVGLDPDDADFGKVRIGNTRLDIWGGFQPVARLVARIGLGAARRVGIAEEDKDLAREVDPLELLARFSSYKLHPTLQLGRALLTGKNAVHQPVTPGQAIVQAFAPLTAQDVYDAMTTDNAMNPVAVGIVTSGGIGAATYEDSELATRKAIRKAREKGNAHEAQRLRATWNQKHPKNRIVNVK